MFEYIHHACASKNTTQIGLDCPENIRIKLSMNSIMNPIHFRNAPKFTIGVLFRIKHAWFVINLNTSMKSNRAGYVEHTMKSVVKISNSIRWKDFNCVWIFESYFWMSWYWSYKKVVETNQNRWNSSKFHVTWPRLMDIKWFYYFSRIENKKIVSVNGYLQLNNDTLWLFIFNFDALFSDM